MLSLSVRKEGVHARVIDRLYREKKAAAGNGEDDGIGAGMAWHGSYAVLSLWAMLYS
jgi:hypothetical protein